MNSAACKFNGLVVRKYFCEACHHEMTVTNKSIDRFYYGDLLSAAVRYEKAKKTYCSDASRKKN